MQHKLFHYIFQGCSKPCFEYIFIQCNYIQISEHNSGIDYMWYDNIVYKTIYRVNSNMEKLKRSFSKAVYASLHIGDSGIFIQRPTYIKDLGRQLA